MVSELLTRLQAALGEAYHVDDELGGGGMSRVFVARETALDRRVVVKVLPPDLAAGVNVERFQREIRLAASLQHPHIVPLLAAGAAQDLLFYIMPYIEGESLRARLVREGELPVRDVVRILRDVMDALARAHELGVVHRDIKPDNVLLSGKHALVMDFGIAKAVTGARTEGSLTSFGIALGTPAYMAPEQAAADPNTDHRADIYSTGVVAYEMLSGRLLFTAPTPQGMLAAHMTEAPQPVRTIRPAVPSALDALVMRCLEKRPADRWQKAEDLLLQLELMATPSGGLDTTASHLVSATSAAPRVGAPPPAARAPRAPWVRALAAAIAVAMLVGATWLGVRSLRSRSASRPMLVVLPFENLGSTDDEYFADGITEAITSRLARISGIGVIARTSASQYKRTKKTIKEVAAELGVTYVLAGTVRWDRGTGGTSRIRVSPELIRVSDRTPVWTEPYEGELSKVFEFQSNAAERVAAALSVTLVATEKRSVGASPTTNMEAYDNFLRGTDFWGRNVGADDRASAIGMFERAVALDSNFALAWGSLSRVLCSAYQHYDDRSAPRLARAKEAADRAFALDSTLPESQLARAYYYYWCLKDYGHALDVLTAAQRLTANNSEMLLVTGLIERRQGRWEEAVASLQRATVLDPRYVNPFDGLWGIHVRLRQYADAERDIEQMIRLSPDPAWPRAKAVNALASRGDTAEALRIQRAALEQFGLGQVVRSLTSGGCGFASGPGLAPRWQCFPSVPAEVERALDTLTLSRAKIARENFYLARALQVDHERQTVRARAYYDSSRSAIESRLRERPDDPFLHANLGVAFAGIGKKTEALREGRRAAELLPVSKDAIDGPDPLENLVEIYMMVGEYDAAIDELKHLRAIPSTVSDWDLRLNPLWDPLRKRPSWQKLFTRQ